MTEPREACWWCLSCQNKVEPHEVTYAERHDERAGGCGQRVAHITERQIELQRAVIDAAKEMWQHHVDGEVASDKEDHAVSQQEGEREFNAMNRMFDLLSELTAVEQGEEQP